MLQERAQNDVRDLPLILEHRYLRLYLSFFNYVFAENVYLVRLRLDLLQLGYPLLDYLVKRAHRQRGLRRLKQVFLVLLLRVVVERLVVNRFRGLDHLGIQKLQQVHVHLR